MYEILKSAHSGWRHIVLILLVVAVLQALMGWLGNKSYSEGSKRLNVFTLIATHIQVLFGLALYFLSPLTKGPMGDALYRYWKVEHISMMLVAVVLITIGNAKSKKKLTDVAKHKTIAIFFGIALLLVVVAIVMMTKVGPAKTFFGVS